MKKNLMAKPVITLITLGFFCLQACNNNSDATHASADTSLQKTVIEEKRVEDTTTQITPADSITATPVSPAAKIDEQKPAPKPEVSTDKIDKSKLETEKPAKVPEVDHASIEAGKNLLATSDCLACHKINEKAVGPAYADIAKKYPNSEANIQLLASKIINGGSGVWGQIPMTPHPALQQDDVKKMVTYILSLD